LTVNVAVVSTDTGVGTLTSPITFTGNQSRVSGSFDPINAGPTDLVMTQPASFQVPANLNQTITATVTAPNINIFNVTVGRDLQVSQFVFLQAAPPSPITVTITSSSGSIATISTDGTVEGGTSVTFSNVSGTSVGTIFVQGRGLGNTVFTATAPGYNSNNSNITVDPSGFGWLTGAFNTTVGASGTNVTLRSARLNPITLNLSQEQNVRGGLTVDVIVTSSDPTIGTATSPITFTGNQSRATGVFTPISVGVTSLDMTQPPGFDIPSILKQSIIATVNP